MADSTLNRFQATGTTAERTAFVPSPPTPASGPDQGYTWFDTDDSTLYAYDFGSAAWVAAGGGGSGTVTNTGTLTSGKTIIGNGSADVTASSLTANLVASSSGALSGAVASANSKLLGSGASGSGSAYAELTLGTNLSMSGTTLNATGGNTTSTAAEASIPAAGTSGNLFFPNNGFWVQRDTGAAWVPWGPLFPMTDPALASISSWDNQSSSTVDTTYGGINLTVVAGTAGVSLRYKSAPSAPYVVTAFILDPMVPGAANSGYCLVFRQNSTGKLYTFNYITTATAANIEVWRWTNSTTFSAAQKTSAAKTPPRWLRIADDNTNLIFSLSPDGQHWVTFYSEARGAFMTGGPDQIGFGGFAASGNPNTSLTLLSWKET